MATRGSLLLAALVACTPREADVSAAPSSAAAPASASSAPVAAASHAVPIPPPVVVPDDGAFAVIDLHVDTPWQIHFKDKPRDLSEGHATLARRRTSASA